MTTTKMMMWLKVQRVMMTGRGFCPGGCPVRFCPGGLCPDTDERQAVADLVLTYVRRDHHENGTSVDENDRDHVVQRTGIILYSVIVAVAMPVRCRCTRLHKTQKLEECCWDKKKCSFVFMPCLLPYFQLVFAECLSIHLRLLRRSSGLPWRWDKRH